MDNIKKDRLCDNCKLRKIPDNEEDGYMCDICYAEVSNAMSEGMFCTDDHSKNIDIFTK